LKKKKDVTKGRAWAVKKKDVTKGRASLGCLKKKDVTKGRASNYVATDPSLGLL
jgi:hypothetical protein